MQLLKALVIIMGVLIVAGFAVIGVEVYKRIVDPTRGNPAATAQTAAQIAPPVEPSSPAPAASVPAASAPTAGKPATDVVLDLPAGSRIGEIVAVGNRVLFKVTLPQGPDRLYLVDPQSGAVQTTITAGKPVP